MTRRGTQGHQGARPAPADPGLPNDTGIADLVRQALAFLRRGYREILLLAAIGAVAAVLLVVQLDRRYQSTLLLMVDPPARSPIEAEPQSAALLDAFVGGQVYVVESSEVLRVVLHRERLIDHPYFRQQPESWLRRTLGSVRDLILPEPPLVLDGPPMDPAEAAALRNLMRNVVVSREGRTNVLRVDVTADTPRTAARIANAIGDAFVENRTRRQTDRAAEIAGWLDGRARELQQQLARAEDAVAAFRIEHNLLSPEPGMLLGDQQLSELNSEMIRTRAALAERNAAYTRARELLESGGDLQSLPEIQRSDIVTGLRTQLLELERRAAAVANTSGSPRLSQMADERAALEAQLAVETGRIIESLRIEVETLRAREGLVAAALDAAGGESGTASRLSVQLRELERRAAAYQALYERYLSSAGLAEESVSYLPSGVTIVDAATTPSTPVFPPTRVIVLFGLILGAGLGAGLAFFRDALRTGYVLPRRAEEDLGLSVLACIPQLAHETSAFHLTKSQPYSPFAESVRTFRHALSGAPRPGTGTILMLTSSSAGEGKTNLSAALAASALTAGKRVLLIDTDLRRAGLTRLFGLKGEKGLSEILRDEDWTFPEPAGQPMLDILPSGQTVKSPADLLASAVMTRYLARARNHYDLIILDGPPVANLADAPILARHADAVGYVIRWNETPRDVVRKAIDRFGAGRVTGLVLNDVDFAVTAQYGDTYESYVQADPEAAGDRRDAPV